MLSVLLIHTVVGGLIACRFRVVALMPALMASGTLILTMQMLNGTSIGFALATVAMASVAMQAGFAASLVVLAARTPAADAQAPSLAKTSRYQP